MCVVVDWRKPVRKRPHTFSIWWSTSAYHVLCAERLLLQRRSVETVHPCRAETMVEEQSLAVVRSLLLAHVHQALTCDDSFHNSLFGSSLLIGVSAIFLVQNPTSNSIKAPLSEQLEMSDEERRAANQPAIAIYSAKWTVSIALSYALFSQTLIALSNRPMDAPGSLKINSRDVRLLPRVLLLRIFLCLPLVYKMWALTFLGSISGLLRACLPWEWWSSLERHGGLMET